MQNLPIGIDAHGERREFDSMGDVRVPTDKYWDAQTQRSLVHFSIGDDRMPKEVYHAYGPVKKACALVNAAEGRLPGWKADAIVRAADETIAGKLDEHYPLYVWQTGSGPPMTRSWTPRPWSDTASGERDLWPESAQPCPRRPAVERWRQCQDMHGTHSPRNDVCNAAVSCVPGPPDVKVTPVLA